MVYTASPWKFLTISFTRPPTNIGRTTLIFSRGCSFSRHIVRASVLLEVVTLKLSHIPREMPASTIYGYLPANDKAQLWLFTNQGFSFRIEQVKYHAHLLGADGILGRPDHTLRLIIPGEVFEDCVDWFIACSARKRTHGHFYKCS